eukprot:409323-Pleurochrysis_carterae.AAC.4
MTGRDCRCALATESDWCRCHVFRARRFAVAPCKAQSGSIKELKKQTGQVCTCALTEDRKARSVVSFGECFARQT